MMNSWLLTAAAAVLTLNLIFYIRLRMKQHQLLHALFLKVEMNLPGVDLDTVLVMSPNGSEALETQLEHLSSKWAVLYDGPEWLYAIKKKKGGERFLRFSSVVDGPKQRLFANSVIVRRYKGKYLIIYEAEQFVKL